MIQFKNLPDTSTPLNAQNLNDNFNELYDRTKRVNCSEIAVGTNYTENNVPGWDWGTIRNLQDKFTAGSEYFAFNGSDGIEIKKDCFAYVYANVSIRYENTQNCDTGLAINTTTAGDIYRTYDRYNGGYQSLNASCVYNFKAGDKVKIKYLNGNDSSKNITILNTNTHYGIIFIGER